MKAFNRTAIALCLSLAILFLTVWSAAAEAANDNTLEIRGPISPVYDGSGISEILSNTAYDESEILSNTAYDDGNTTARDATQSVAFVSHIDPGMVTESTLSKNVTLK